MPPRRGSGGPFPRTLTLGFLGLFLLAFTGVLLANGWDWLGERQGGKVDAEVLRIRTNVPGRRVYDVRLTTRSGRSCIAEVDSGSNPSPRVIRVGETSRVVYSAHHPCDKFAVRESASASPSGGVGFAAVVVVICGYALWQVHRQPRRRAVPPGTSELIFHKLS